MATPGTVPSSLELQQKSMQQLANVPAKDLIGVEPLEITLRNIIDGSVAGSTNDAVLRFEAASDAFVGDASTLATAQMQAVHSATDGDSIVLRRAGKYDVEFCFSQAASNECRLGISADVASAGLTSLPAMTIAGMRQCGGGLLPASTTAYHVLKTEVTVTEAEARVGKVVRAHGTVAAGSVILDASINVNTDCYLRVSRKSTFIA
jgi:hypothetical protein